MCVPLPQRARRPHSTLPAPFPALRVLSAAQPPVGDRQPVLRVRIPASAGLGPRVVASAAGFRLCVCLWILRPRTLFDEI